jgi:hypothetical protein
MMRIECKYFSIATSITKTMKLVFVASPLSTQHYGDRVKIGWLGIRIMCQEWGDMSIRGLLLQ